MFVFDPTNKDIVVPAYIDRQLTAASDTCVSVGTQASVDGDTEISLGLGGDHVPTDLLKAFVGSIDTSGGKVALVTSEFQKILELDIEASSVQVTIMTDDLHSPSRVAIRISPACRQQ